MLPAIFSIFLSSPNWERRDVGCDAPGLVRCSSPQHDRAVAKSDPSMFQTATLWVGHTLALVFVIVYSIAQRSNGNSQSVCGAGPIPLVTPKCLEGDARERVSNQMFYTCPVYRDSAHHAGGLTNRRSDVFSAV
jgi:hypothetical protein